MEVKFDMTTRQKIVFECLQEPHAQYFLLAILIDGLGQHMPPIEYHTILKYRLMIPLFSIDEVSMFAIRHVWIPSGSIKFIIRSFPTSNKGKPLLGLFFLIYLGRQIFMKKEAPLKFLTDPQKGRSTLRPSYVRVYEWVGEKNACVHWIVVPMACGIGYCGFCCGINCPQSLFKKSGQT